MSCLMVPLEDDDLKIERGRLFVSLHYWLPCASWGRNNYTYIFRMEGQRVRLIGLNHSSLMRPNHEAWRESSINYLTGRKKLTQGHGETVKESWQHLRGKRHFYIGERLPRLGDESLQHE